VSVYFAQVGRYVKVGYSANPERRVANLFKSATRYGIPRDLDIRLPRHLLAAVPGHLNEERAAHAALDDFRVWGEWFLDEPEVRDYIRRCVGADDVATERVVRPAGQFDWNDDPALGHTDPAANRQVAEALSGIFARLST
jgi:hypothetical protein